MYSYQAHLQIFKHSPPTSFNFSIRSANHFRFLAVSEGKIQLRQGRLPIFGARKRTFLLAAALTSLWRTDSRLRGQGSLQVKAMEGDSAKQVRKGLLQTDELYQYILENSVYPREPEPLKEIRAATASHPRHEIATASDSGQLMALLLNLINAKKTIEIGVFTGYSLLLTALSIPDDGKIIAIDMDREAYEIGLPIIRKAGVEHKIDFIESPALPVLDKLVEEKQNEGSFDYAYVDADKVNCWNYHERLLKLIRTGGLIVYDNTLWGGSVALPDELVPDRLKETKVHTVKLNKMLADDSRVQLCQIPLGDGVTVCRRL